jgi:hypothetical protein
MFLMHTGVMANLRPKNEHDSSATPERLLAGG